jgi:hypothetical protein
VSDIVIRTARGSQEHSQTGPGGPPGSSEMGILAFGAGFNASNQTAEPQISQISQICNCGTGAFAPTQTVFMTRHANSLSRSARAVRVTRRV